MNFLRLTWTGGYDANGFKKLKLELLESNNLKAECFVYSGAPRRQVEPFIYPANDWSGSGRPIPEGVYKIGEPEVGDFGDAIGHFWASLEVLPQARSNDRGSFGIHEDANFATSPGSAGCCSMLKPELERVIYWLKTFKPTYLYVDYNLGFLKKVGLLPQIAGAEKLPEPPKQVPTPKPSSDGKKPYRAKGILLEIGHGPYPGGWEPGACANGVKEYDLNTLAALSAKAVIEKEIPCEVTDSGLELHDIGMIAKGYDGFVSFHHNSSGVDAQGTEVLIHANKSNAEDAKAAQFILDELCNELKFNNRGVKKQLLGVLSGAEDVRVPFAVLCEPYFLDALKSGHKELSVRAGQAIGRGVLKYMQQKYPVA